MPPSGEPSPDVFSGTRCLVTGGAGFIGSHLSRALLDLGAEVRILDDLSSGHRTNVPAGATLIEGSILDAERLAEAMDGVRIVFHEAAMVSVPESIEKPIRCHEVNVTGTVRVLEAARAAGARRLVFASSSAVYGEKPNVPSRETDTVDCCSPYAASKAAGEAFVAAYGRCTELSTVNLRYFNVFGPRQDPKSPYAAAIASFVDRVRSGERPTVFGDGMQTRDWVPVENVVRANLLAAQAGEDACGEAFNVGTGERASLLEVIAAIGAVVGEDVEPMHAPPRPGDVPESGADIAKARAGLGYAPTAGLRDGLAALLATV